MYKLKHVTQTKKVAFYVEVVTSSTLGLVSPPRSVWCSRTDGWYLARSCNSSFPRLWKGDGKTMNGNGSVSTRIFLLIRIHQTHFTLCFSSWAPWRLVMKTQPPLLSLEEYSVFVLPVHHSFVPLTTWDDPFTAAIENNGPTHHIVWWCGLRCFVAMVDSQRRGV